MFVAIPVLLNDVSTLESLERMAHGIRERGMVLA